MNRTARVVVVAVLLLAVAAVLVLRGKVGRGTRSEAPMPSLVAEGTVQEEGDTSLAQTEAIGSPTEMAPVPVASALPKGTVATIDGRPITEEHLYSSYESLPPQYKQEFAGDMEAFLDQIIVRDLLFHEAKRRGHTAASADGSEDQEAVIQAFVDALGSAVQVSDGEARQFYSEHAEEVQGATFEQVEGSIRGYLGQQKFLASISSLIDSLRGAAQIVKNQEWLAAQRALQPPDPLEPALQSGKPTLLDLGSDTCVPCKMMKPILDELKEEYKGRANILIVDVYQHRRLARQLQVRVIPTQVFFDGKGKAFWRHEGFLSKAEIVEKLKELGVE
ncbi:MAG: thioredoxin domain-containing protein [Candidatus Oleimicrobiaceae bacterium]